MRFIEEARIHRTTPGVRTGHITVEAVRGILASDPQLRQVIFSFKEDYKGAAKIPDVSIDAEIAEGLTEYLLRNMDQEAMKRIFLKMGIGSVYYPARGEVVDL